MICAFQDAQLQPRPSAPSRHRYVPNVWAARPAGCSPSATDTVWVGERASLSARFRFDFCSRHLHLAAFLVSPWKASTPARYVRQLHAPALRAWAGQPGRNEINRHSPDAGRRRQGRAGCRPGVGPPALAHVRPGGPGCHHARLFPCREAASGGAAPRLPRHPRPGSCRCGYRLSISSPRISRAPPGSPYWLAVPPGGYGGQAELAHRPIPAAEADGRAAVTDRDLEMNANRRSGAGLGRPT